MWISLTDEKLIEIYKKGFLPDEVPNDIILLLSQLQKKTYAEKLSVVTSVGNLYLTTALSWEDTEKNHIVRIRQGIDTGKPTIIMSYHTDSFNKAAAKRECSLEAAADYIDLYVMRLLEEKCGEL
jgi:hypothetical protein